MRNLLLPTMLLCLVTAGCFGENQVPTTISAVTPPDAQAGPRAEEPVPAKLVSVDPPPDPIEPASTPPPNMIDQRDVSDLEDLIPEGLDGEVPRDRHGFPLYLQIPDREIPDTIRLPSHEVEQ